MYALKRESIDITALASTSTDPLYPVANVLDKFTKSVTKSAVGVNNFTLTYTSVKLSDIDLYNTNAIAGTVTIKDSTGTTTLATETLDFFTVTNINYMTLDDVDRGWNIRAFHGDQWYDDVIVEIYLEADVGVQVYLGIIASGVFIRYGGCETISPTLTGISYSVAGSLAEYYNFLSQVNRYREFFIHHYQKIVDGENMWMSYGIPTLGSPSHLGTTGYKYSVEVKV